MKKQHYGLVLKSERGLLSLMHVWTYVLHSMPSEAWSSIGNFLFTRMHVKRVAAACMCRTLSLGLGTAGSKHRAGLPHSQ